MNPEPATAAPKKKSNVGLIIGIIVGALVIAGGTVAAILLINNANNNGGGEGNEGGDEEVAQDVKEPYKNDKAYFIKIDGKAFTNQSKMKDLSKVGYTYKSALEDTNVKPKQYLIVIGGAYLNNSEKGTNINVVPYNDGTETVKYPDAKLGKIGLVASNAKKDIYEKIEVYGGIHLGSTKEEVVKAFGEATNVTKSTDYKGDPTEKLEYKADVWKKYEITLTNDEVTEISWVNYGGLNN